MHSLRRARAPAFFLLCACAEKPDASLVVETEAIDFGVVEVGASATSSSQGIASSNRQASGSACEARK